MSERSTLKGSRLGGTSFEDETGIEFAPRQHVAYDCQNGHDFDIPMAADAEIPFEWECPRCGAQSRRRDAQPPEPKLDRPARTHWDMLLERRSIPELEDILSERLEMLRSGVIGPAHLHRDDAQAGTAPKSKKSA
jgi:rubredoxin